MDLEHISIRKPPVNLCLQDEDLFSHEYRKEFVSSDINVIRNILLDSEGVFLAHVDLPAAVDEKTPVAKYSFQHIFVLCIRSILRFRLKIRFKKYLWITDSWSLGYFHWLMDVLPKLEVALQTIPSNEVNLLLPHTFSRFEYVIKSLHSMGVRKVVFTRPYHYYFLRRLNFQGQLAPTGNYNELIINKMREHILMNMHTDDTQCISRIYISRSKAKRRMIANELAFEELLISYNFFIVHFEDYNWDEQVKLCSKADILIGLHGAGLSNMLFMPKGAKVLEFRPYGDDVNNCYFSLASALHLKYYYQLCKTDNKEILSANFIVDIDLLKENIELLINE